MDWITKQNNTCPNCKLPHFSPYEVLPNNAFEKQYAKWKADPENYSFEKAFQEEYHRTAEEVGILAEQILRPKELRDKERQEKLTDEQIQRYYEYGNRRIMELTPNATKEQIAIAKRIEDQADQLMIGNIQEKVETIASDHEQIRQVNARQWQALGEMHMALDQEDLIRTYEKQVSSMSSIIEQHLKELRAVPREKKDYPLIKTLSTFSQNLHEFKTRFSEAGDTKNQTIEESREQLEQVNAELEAFLSNQPESIQRLLGRKNSSSTDLSTEEPVKSEPPNKKTPERRCPKNWITRLKTAFIATTIIGVCGLFYCYTIGGSGEL